MFAVRGAVTIDDRGPVGMLVREALGPVGIIGCNGWMIGLISRADSSGESILRRLTGGDDDRRSFLAA